MNDSYRGCEVIEVNCDEQALQEPDVEALVSGRAAAIRLKNFCPPAVCEAMTDFFLADVKPASHPAALKAGWSVGLSIASALQSPEQAAQYIAETEPIRAKLRRASGDAGSPLDRLVAELCGASPHGVAVGTLPDLGRMHIATVRVLNAHTDIFAHTIDLGLKRYAAWTDFFAGLRAVLSFNVYLQCRPPGGRLYLYLRRLPEHELARLKGDNYGIPLELLGEPACILQPEVGEVIIFQSTKLHGVTGTENQRITLGGFLGVPKSAGPISMWV